MDKIIISVSAVAFILLVILAAYLWKKKYLRFTDDNIIFIMTAPRETFFIGKQNGYIRNRKKNAGGISPTKEAVLC